MTTQKTFKPPEFRWKKAFALKHPRFCYYGNYTIYHGISMLFLGIVAYCFGNIFFYKAMYSSTLSYSGNSLFTLSLGQVNPYAENVADVAIMAYIMWYVIKLRKDLSERYRNLAVAMFSLIFALVLFDMIVGNWGHFDFNPVARNIDSSAHDLVYAEIFLYALIVRIHQPMNIKGLFVSIGLVMFTVAVCECMFNTAYYIFLVPNNQLRADVALAGIATFGNLALLITSLGVPAYFKIWTVLNKTWFRISVLSFFIFLCIWVAIGFPITINSVIGETVYYHSFFVNGWEELSWTVYFIPAIIAYLLPKNHEYKEDVLI